MTDPTKRLTWQTGAALALTAALIVGCLTALQQHGADLREFVFQGLGQRQAPSASLVNAVQQHWKLFEELPERQQVTRAAMAPPMAVAVGYSADGLRDPLQSLLPKEPEPLAKVPAPAPAHAESLTPPPVPKIQGVMLGQSGPKAIINGEVYGIGGVVNGTTIVSIDRNNITVDYHGVSVVYPIAGAGDGPESSRASWAHQ